MMDWYKPLECSHYPVKVRKDDMLNPVKVLAEDVHYWVSRDTGLMKEDE